MFRLSCILRLLFCSDVTAKTGSMQVNTGVHTVLAVISVTVTLRTFFSGTLESFQYTDHKVKDDGRYETQDKDAWRALRCRNYDDGD